MTTANQIIGQALGLLGIRSSADPVSGADAALALERLNTIIDAMRADSLMAYATTTVTATLPASAGSRTIGPGAQIDTARPIRIEDGSFFTTGGVDYPIEQIGEPEFNAIGLKAIDGLGPRVLFFDASLPTATVYFYPRAAAPVTLSLVVLTQVASFADLTTSYNLAPGYLRMLVYALAVELAPDFEREAPPSVIRAAGNARRSVERMNNAVAQLDVCSPPRGGFDQAAFLAGF